MTQSARAASDCAIILDRPKTPDNAGTILRSTLALAGPETTVIVAGARWPLDRFPLSKLRTDPSSAARRLNIVTVENLETAWSTCKLWNYELLVVERGTPHSMYLDRLEHPNRAAYIFGPEDGGVECPRSWRTTTLEIRSASNLDHPVQGCLNLATAVSIVLYDRLLQSRYPR